MGTLSLPTIGKKGITEDPKILAALEALNGLLDAENKASIKPVRWYPPKIIATEESRTNTAFGTLETKDEIKEVALPENGLIQIGYSANFKSSVAASGRAAIFIGSNQLKVDQSGSEPKVQEAGTVGTAYRHLFSHSGGLEGQTVATWGGDVTTGQAIGGPLGSISSGGFCTVFAAAGKYDISVQFKATSGSITAKERKLWVCTLGY